MLGCKSTKKMFFTVLQLFFVPPLAPSVSGTRMRSRLPAYEHDIITDFVDCLPRNNIILPMAEQSEKETWCRDDDRAYPTTLQIDLNISDIP